MLFIVIITIITIIIFTITGFQIFTYLNNPNRETLSELLSNAKKDSVIQDLIGTWQIKDPRWPVKQITISDDSIGVATKDEMHYLGCTACNSNPVGFVTVPVNTLIFKDDNKLTESLKNCLKGLDYIYKLVLHANGVVKFILHPGLVEKCDIICARSDSKNDYTFILNIIHRYRYGCFCLGILNPDGGSIQRYNRWSDKYPDQYYKMVKLG